MGACLSPNAELQLSRVINADINSDKKKQTAKKKILFLGSGGSGKSTLFKQLRLIHGQGFNDTDREEYIPYIHTQVINQMKAILRIYIDYNHRKQQRENGNKHEDDIDVDELLIYDELRLQSAELNDMKSAELVIDYQYDKKLHSLPSEICGAIQSLWSEPIVKEIYASRNITNIETSSAHFWGKMDEIKDSDYLPSTQDILLNRVVTTGLHEQQFEIKNSTIHIIDVGGQRSQRRKWIHCFEHVVAVIFIASLSCYDAVMNEDQNTNAMSDQLALFDAICNDYILSKVSMILFANKTDLFREKHCKQKIALGTCPEFNTFSDESCNWDYKKATAFILKAFKKINKSKSKKIYSHLTCATDTNNIEKVFSDVQEIVIAGNLMDSGLFVDD